MGLVLFICVENRFRSQIAEAYFNRHAPNGWKAISAGLTPAKEVHPNAVKLMLEDGIDISHKKPQALTRELQGMADIIIVACSGACPIIYAKKVEKWDIPDPAEMTIEEARKVRDIIKGRVLDLIERIKSSG